MQFQLCHYKVVSNKPKKFKLGIAKLNTGFNSCDVVWIADAVTGEVITPNELYDYLLINAPLAHIDTRGSSL